MAALGSSWQACPVAKPATAQRADPPHECINVPMRAVCMNIIGGRPMHVVALVRCSDWHASYRVPLRAKVGSRH